MTVSEFEEAVWDLEKFRIVIRAGVNEEVQDYDYSNAAQSTISLTTFFRNRITPRVDGNEFDVIDGFGTLPHGGTHLENVRNSYGAE